MTWDATHWLESTKRLQEESFGKTYPMEGEVLANDIAMNHSAAVVELSEFMQEVGWKNWAEPRGWVNRDAAVGELVDVLHFVANLAIAINVTDEELATRYEAKQKLNAQRQADGYDGRNKCPGCGRALDDLGALCQRLTAEELSGLANTSKHTYFCNEYGYLGES